MHPAIGILKTLFGLYYQRKNLIHRRPWQFYTIIDKKKNDCVILSVISFLLASFYLQYLFLLTSLYMHYLFCRRHFICNTFFLRLCHILFDVTFNLLVSCDRCLRCMFKQLWLKCLPLFMAARSQLMTYLPIISVRIAYPIFSILPNYKQLSYKI